MSIDKKITYAVTVAFPCFILLVYLIPDDTSKNIILAALCVLFAALTLLFIKKRGILRLEKRQILLVMSVLSVFVVMLGYMTGIKFGFVKNPIVTLYLWKYILPYAVIIASSEIVRKTLLAQQSRFVFIFTYFSFVILDCAMLSGGIIFDRYDDFADFFGMILFPALTSNILYHYLSGRYGALPNIVYKTVISLYRYVIPILPKMPDMMLSFSKVILPLIICLCIYELYRKKKSVVSRVRNRIGIAAVCVSFVLTFACVMLISRQFQYGLIVVGSESMSGEIEKGDGIVFEQYDGQVLEEGRIIVFNRDGTEIIHRIIDVENINGEIRYYTKGDANDSADPGYITSDDIVGTLTLNIKYIGLPTIWIRSLFT